MAEVFSFFARKTRPGTRRAPEATEQSSEIEMNIYLSRGILNSHLCLSLGDDDAAGNFVWALRSKYAISELEPAQTQTEFNSASILRPH